LPDSSNQAFAKQNELLGFYATEIDTAGERGYELQRRELIDLRSAMVDDLNAKGALLPDETTVTLTESIPAFTLGYELYGDAFRGEEIVSNNAVPNPLFLPPQEDLLVLTS